MRAFLQMLSELADGRTADECQRALLEVSERVVETGKAGKLNLAITIKPATKGNRSMHSISVAVTTNLPKGEAEESILYVTEGGYTRRDPRQPEIPGLRDVKAAEGDPERNVTFG